MASIYRTDWTPEDDAKVLQMWADKFTATQIGDAIGRTKNSVLGRIHRLGAAARKPTPERKREAAPPKPDSVPRVRVPKVRLTPRVLIEPPPRKRPKRGKLLSLLDLTSETCRWPTGDVDKPGFGFCGQPPVATRPYCNDHCRLAYQPPAQRQSKPAVAWRNPHG